MQSGSICPRDVPSVLSLSSFDKGKADRLSAEWIWTIKFLEHPDNRVPVGEDVRALWSAPMERSSPSGLQLDPA